MLVGNLLVDDIVLADGGTLLGEPGGAVLHAALAASLWGCRVGIVSVAGSDYPPTALEARWPPGASSSHGVRATWNGRAAGPGCSTSPPPAA